MTQNANKLIDTAIDRNNLKNDAALSRLLDVAPPVVSKVRHNRLPVGDNLLVRLHEKCGMTFPEMRLILAGT